MKTKTALAAALERAAKEHGMIKEGPNGTLMPRNAPAWVSRFCANTADGVGNVRPYWKGKK